MEALAQRLRSLRRSLKITQTALAASLGIHPITLCLIEKGRTPNKSNAAKIAVWIERNNGSQGTSASGAA